MKVEIKKPSEKEIEALGIRSWPVWEKEKSAFDWFYDEKETCYFLEGDVEIELPDKSKVKITGKDMVIFPKGLKCKWNIKARVRKHYKFGP